MAEDCFDLMRKRETQEVKLFVLEELEYGDADTFIYKDNKGPVKLHRAGGR